MRKINFSTQVLPHVVAVLLFLLVTVLFFHPIFFENRTLQQHDIQQFIGSSKAIDDFRERTGEEPLWTNAMFSGMPAWLISVQWGNQAIAYLKTTLALFTPHPIANIFLAFVCYYIMLLAFGVRPYLAMAGAIAFGLSSYLIIGLSAGHNGRIGAIAFMPLIMAGIHLVFTGRRVLGFGVTAAAMALHLRENHIQMTYYLLLIVLLYGIVMLLEAIRQKTVPVFFKNVLLLTGAVVLAVATFFGQFWALKEYSKHSTRGQSELVKAEEPTTSTSGMTREYAFEFSNGIFEPFTLMIPNFYGGSSGNFLVSDPNSEVYKALMRSGDQQMANQLANFTGAYWGEQRLAAPYYAGAVIVFLFALGICFAPRRYATWLCSAALLGIVLSWGSNFAAFNYFMFDYFPGYNNFRSVTFTLIITLFAMPLLGLLGLERVLSEKFTKETRRKLLIAFSATGGLCLVFGLFAGAFTFTRDIEAQLPGWFVDALADDRKSLFRSDAFRSLAFILVVFLALWFEAHRKVSATGFYAFIIFLVTVDLYSVDKRYFPDDNFRRKRDNTFFAMTEADQEILKDRSYYRVYNLSYLTGSGTNPFAEARTSYYHNSVGGYHGAKMRRYAEFYDSCVVSDTQRFVGIIQSGSQSFDSLRAFNMLNIKYLVLGPQREHIVQNQSAYGNAWFVEDIIPASNANEELAQTCRIDTRRHAVINTREFHPGTVGYDSASSITLVEYDLQRLRFESQSATHGLAVFSDIYYPGWVVTIDGQEAPLMRANYILRAVEIPAGQHSIEFVFKPDAYVTGNKVTTATSWLVLLVLVGSIGWSFRTNSAKD